jgi:hypothetical protein
MTKNTLRKIIAYSVVTIVLFQSCKDDSYLTVPLPVPDQSFTESFDNYDQAYAKGWRSVNTSSPVGRKWYDVAETPNFGSVNYLVTYSPEWAQAQFTLDSLQFPNAPYPQRYWAPAFFSQNAVNGYAATSIACANVINFSGASDPYNLSCWLTSPELIIKNGDKIIFYTYSKGVARLQLWINTTNSLNVGTNVNSTGDFDIKLLDINPGYAEYEADPANAFPPEWTRFEGEVKGLSKTVTGRFAFRYLLQNQDPVVRSALDPNNLDTLYNQIHKSVIGIDEVTYNSAK